MAASSGGAAAAAATPQLASSHASAYEVKRFMDERRRAEQAKFPRWLQSLENVRGLGSEALAVYGG